MTNREPQILPQPVAFIPRRRFLTHLLALVALLAGAAAPLRAALNPQEQELANLLVNAAGQNRPFMTLDPILTRVARQRAADLALRHYFAHTNPDGKAANWLVYEAGYALPSLYLGSQDQNNIESIAAGQSSASATWNDWMNSSPHRQHLLAENAFYAGQTAYGVGYYHAPDSEYIDYWVVITAPPGPELSISKPHNNARVTEAQVMIEGESGGLPRAGRVDYRLENAAGIGDYQPASGVGSWAATVEGLLPGENTIRVHSVDTNEVTLKEVRRVVYYALFRPLVVTMLGEGSVSEGFAGTSFREVGHGYTITANAAPGWVFAGWSGGLSGADATRPFTMSEGLVLTTNFIRNPFASLQGSFSGLIGADTANYERTGFLRIRLGSRGDFTGHFTWAGTPYVFKGRFDLQGGADLTIAPPGKTPLTVRLHLDLTNGGEQITGTVSDDSFTASFDVNRAAAGEDLSPYVGRYTLRFPEQENAGPEVPRGDGYAVLTVGAFGPARIAGSLADGSPFVRATQIASSGATPLYVPLYGRTGAIAGVLTFRVTSRSDVDGICHWSRPARPEARFYPQPLETNVAAFGVRYTPPASRFAAANPTNDAGNAEFWLGEGNLDAPIVQSVTLSKDHRILLASPLTIPGLAITLNPACGRFRGTFIHPVTQARTAFRGVIFQRDNAGYGFFLGVDESGFARVAPK